MIVVDAKLSSVLLQLVIEVNHAPLVDLRGLSFGLAPNYLDLLTFSLVIELLAEHPVLKMALLEEHKMVSWQKPRHFL